MPNGRTDLVMDHLVRGIDMANAANPVQFDGLTFIVIIAEPKTGELSWSCSESTELGLNLMLSIVEAETLAAADGGTVQ